ncbi:MAG TPA: radical SAM protein [Saprospiraceae bacterium]|nr:radical SAM protein [Saprospiraceae bacterium]
MNVLLSHGYFLDEDLKERAIMKPYPPLGLLYLAAWLDLHSVENEVFDTTFSSKPAFYEYLLKNRPRIVALYTNLFTKPNLIGIMRFIRSQEALRNSLVVLGGSDVMHNVADYLACGADLIVIGEGEQTLLDIALTVDGGRRTVDGLSGKVLTKAGGQEAAGGRYQVDFSHIPGLAYRLPDGSVFKTAPREKLRDLDRLPFPARHKIDHQLYLDLWKKRHGYNTMSISTQRGCPYTCRWCSTAVYGQSYRRNSPKSVVDEIEFLQKNYDFDIIWFVDDVFTINYKWLGEFRDELARRNIRIRFECTTRSDRLNEEVVKMLKDCGCFRVWIGAESGSQRIIDAMDRRVDVVQVREMIQAAQREGMEAGTFIMLGYPGETDADIRETLRHLKAANPDFFTITVVYPIKGTGLYEEVQARATIASPWAESTDRDIDFKRTYPRRYYYYAVRWVVNAASWHKARQANDQFSINGLKSLVKACIARAGMLWWRVISAPPDRNSS